MSSSNQKKTADSLPENMVTPIVSLRELGQAIAAQHLLPAGIYDLVIEYKFGPGRLVDGQEQMSAMAITFGGLGLRRVEERGPLTIVVGDGAPGKKKPTRKRSAGK